MKLILSLSIFLISTIFGYSQITPGWGNNFGGRITGKQLLSDSLVLNSANGQRLNYVISSFVLSYGFQGGDWEYRIESNKIPSSMKKNFRSFPIGERIYINNINALIDNRPVRIQSSLMFRFDGPRGCLRKNDSSLTIKSRIMSKKQFLDNYIVDVYTSGDYSTNRTDISSRIDTSYTVKSYYFRYFNKEVSKKRYIEVNSNLITEEIRNLVRAFPYYKTDDDYQNISFSNITAIDNVGDTIGVSKISISISTEYPFPELKNAHPNAKELINEAFFFDRNDRTGPFGVIETYFRFSDWRNEHQTKNPSEFLLKHFKSRCYPLFDLTIRKYGLLKPYIKKSSMHFSFLTRIDREIISVAFGQLYFEGEIESEILKMAEDALVRQLHPKIISKWSDDYKDREFKLNKMLEIIRTMK